MMAQEPPWLWSTLPVLGFPMITDEYRRPIHPEVEEYMRRYVTDEQDGDNVDDEDCWWVNYTEPTTEIKDKINLSFTHGEKDTQRNNRPRGNNRNQKEKGSRFHMHLDTPKP